MNTHYRWLVTITPTEQGLTKHPLWTAFPGPIAVYDQTDLDVRVVQIRRAMDLGDIAAFQITPRPEH